MNSRGVLRKNSWREKKNHGILGDEADERRGRERAAKTTKTKTPAYLPLASFASVSSVPVEVHVNI